MSFWLRTDQCLKMLAQLKDLPGDVAELGVSTGTTTFPLADLMMKITPDKKLYACDTYSGLPYDEIIHNGHEMKQGEYNGGNSFKHTMLVHPRENIVIIEGLVEETLPRYLEETKFCFVWVDMDLYRPTSFAYDFLKNRMIVGGVIGFHDYKNIKCPGIQKVIDEEIEKQQYQMILLVNTCIFFKRIR